MKTSLLSLMFSVGFLIAAEPAHADSNYTMNNGVENLSTPPSDIDSQFFAFVKKGEYITVSDGGTDTFSFPEHVVLKCFLKNNGTGCKKTDLNENEWNIWSSSDTYKEATRSKSRYLCVGIYGDKVNIKCVDAADSKYVGTAQNPATIPDTFPRRVDVPIPELSARNNGEDAIFAVHYFHSSKDCTVSNSDSVAAGCRLTEKVKTQMNGRIILPRWSINVSSGNSNTGTLYPGRVWVTDYFNVISENYYTWGDKINTYYFVSPYGVTYKYEERQFNGVHSAIKASAKGLVNDKCSSYNKSLMDTSAWENSWDELTCPTQFRYQIFFSKPPVDDAKIPNAAPVAQHNTTYDLVSQTDSSKYRVLQRHAGSPSVTLLNYQSSNITNANDSSGLIHTWVKGAPVSFVVVVDTNNNNVYTDDVNVILVNNKVTDGKENTTQFSAKDMTDAELVKVANVDKLNLWNPGTGSFYWNGKDGKGTTVPRGRKFNIKAKMFYVDPLYVTYTDVEYLGGIKITALANAHLNKDGLVNADEYATVHWDHSNFAATSCRDNGVNGKCLTTYKTADGSNLLTAEKKASATGWVGGWTSGVTQIPALPNPNPNNVGVQSTFGNERHMQFFTWSDFTGETKLTVDNALVTTPTLTCNPTEGVIPKYSLNTGYDQANIKVIARGKVDTDWVVTKEERKDHTMSQTTNYWNDYDVEANKKGSTTGSYNFRKPKANASWSEVYSGNGREDAWSNAPSDMNHSDWITGEGFANGKLNYSPNGVWWYKLDFYIADEDTATGNFIDPSEMTLIFDFLVDNWIRGIWVNGEPVTITKLNLNTNKSEGTWDPATAAKPLNQQNGYKWGARTRGIISDGFKTGLNTLMIQVTTAEDAEGLLMQLVEQAPACHHFDEVSIEMEQSGAWNLENELDLEYNTGVQDYSYVTSLVRQYSAPNNNANDCGSSLPYAVVNTPFKDAWDKYHEYYETLTSTSEAGSKYLDAGNRAYNEMVAAVLAKIAAIDDTDHARLTLQDDQLTCLGKGAVLNVVDSKTQAELDFNLQSKSISTQKVYRKLVCTYEAKARYVNKNGKAVVEKTYDFPNGRPNPLTLDDFKSLSSNNNVRNIKCNIYNKTGDLIAGPWTSVNISALQADWAKGAKITDSITKDDFDANVYGDASYWALDGTLTETSPSITVTSPTPEFQTPIQIGFWQIIGAHCNQKEWNAMMNTLTGKYTAVQNTTKTHVAYSKNYESAAKMMADNGGALMWGDATNATPRAITRTVGFYDKECSFECISSSNTSDGASANNGATTNVRETIAVVSGKYGAVNRENSRNTNSNSFIFFRDNMKHNVSVDVFYPKKVSGEVIYNGEAPLTTTISRLRLCDNASDTKCSSPNAKLFEIYTCGNNPNCTSTTRLFNSSSTNTNHVVQKNWNSSTEKTKNAETLSGLHRAFSFQSVWASEQEKKQSLQIKWEYNPYLVSKVPTTAVGFTYEAEQVVGSTSEVNTRVEGKCYATFGETTTNDTLSVYQNYTGTGTTNILDGSTTVSGFDITDYENNHNLIVSFMRAVGE